MAYQALSMVTGRGSGSLRRRWSFGGGAGVARRGLRTAMAMAELWALGGCCSGEERAPGAKWERGMARAGAGDVKAALGRGVAYADRALATRGRRRGHAARGFCRCRPLTLAIQFVR